MSSTKNNASATSDDFQQKIDGLLQLVTNRSQGRINDELVENAVSSLITSVVGNVKSKSNNINNINNKQQEEEKIIQDEDNYDDLEDEETKAVTKKDKLSKDSIASQKKGGDVLVQEPKWTGPKATIASIEEQEAQLKEKEVKVNNKKGNIDFSEQWNKLDDIPLGRIGAKMMVTFGDNIETDPGACAAALAGTRQCIQNAIKDARALRRKMKIDYNRAKVMANLHKAQRKARSVLKEESEAPISGNVDPNMLFKAIGGYDKIATEPKCGFDDTQLERLFPEEMNAYKRWRSMHKAYTDSKDENSKQSEKNEDDDIGEDQEDTESSSQPKENTEWGGHLSDRMAQFDARTERMKENWYMAFSVVRQGSFLSRTYSTEDRQWEKTRKQKGKGKGKKLKDSWESLPASYVQFLHWVGFDHLSALPPPNEETTEALAFLGYDFMGKIIEKAIFLRCLEKRQERRNLGDNSEKIILELESGEQLTKDDIELGLNDSTIGVKPLYCAKDSVIENGTAIQLYFGPGFEDRIEMELEQ